jgi:16S rRNA A1518/A1519 N6-dimethyltransferase RsmA/KsgA/DIM1 with predicted DNA glycosylase/AP lyase activity
MLLEISTVAFIILFWMFYTKFFGAEYYPAEQKVIDKALEFSKLKKDEIFYDLGSGDGKVLLEAAKHCRKAVGIEIDPLRVLISRLKCKGKNIEIMRRNFYSCNLKGADVVFIYLRQWTNDRLEQKFLREMKKGSRIISYWWRLSNLNPYKFDEKLRVYAYRI